MPPPPASDVFPALFGALRSRLNARMVPSDNYKADNRPPVHAGPLAAPARAFSCASDAFLASLSASDTNTLRHKRLSLNKSRLAKRRQLQQLDALATAECDIVLQEAEAHDQKFQFFMTETHIKAMARLQTLFFECITEMKKALVRMESVAADTTEESESMAEDLMRRYEWEFFLARLQQDCGGDVEASLLVPTPVCDPSNVGGFSASVQTVVQRVLKEHGPALENGETFVVRSVSTLRRAAPQRPTLEKNSRSTPSLHFGSSASELWVESLENVMRPPNSVKTRRSTSSSLSSTRRLRRLPASKGAIPACESTTFLTGDGLWSTFRRLAAPDTLRFPGTACDIPLSSLHIGWTLPKKTFFQAASDQSGGWNLEELADTNIYYDVADYEQNFAAVMQNYATSNTSTAYSVDYATLASVRRSLREMNAILERPLDQKEGYSADTIFATRQARVATCVMTSATNHTEAADGGRKIFARASVLQLVQTLYYANHFLALLPLADVDTLKKLYPTSLFGEGCLTTLYVPVVSSPEERKVQQENNNNNVSYEVQMSPLDDSAIHELLLLYVARGRHTLTHTSGMSDRHLTSLAYLDALNTLVPHGDVDSNQQSSTRFCVIKSPWKLCEPKETAGTFVPTQLQRFRDADIIFVECSVSAELAMYSSTRQAVVSQNTKTQAMLEMLGTWCMWRSCIMTHRCQDLQNDPTLCRWHTPVQHFLEDDESMQYVPNGNRMREAFLSAENESLMQRTKRVIQTSSSLLEELSSRHLSHSITAFYEHVIKTASNQAYQTQFLGVARLNGISDGGISTSELEQSQLELRHAVDISDEILGTEHCISRELQQLLQLTVYPGVEDSFIQHGFCDLEELQTDIRTRDFGLLLRLSQQRLQVLERRRKDEEKQVARRLASTSLPSISFHSALEQAGLNEPELSAASVYDVIHVMRKGRQSLLREQRQQAQGGAARNESKRNAPLRRGLERCASDLTYRVSPYEANVSTAAKYRASGVSNGRKTLLKNSNR